MTEEKVKFGLGQITNTTPKFAKYLFRAVLYIAAAVNLVLSVIDEIPPDVKAMIGKYSIYAVTLVHGFSKLFGIEVEQTRNYR